MEHSFHMLLYRAFHAQRHYLRPSLREAGLEPGQPKLLEYLCRYGACPQRKLANYFEIDSAAVSRMLDGMEREGLIFRRTNAVSRRSNLVEVTEKGRQAYQIWQQCCQEMEQVLLQGFSQKEKEALFGYLSRIYQNFQEDKEVRSCRT